MTPRAAAATARRTASLGIKSSHHRSDPPEATNRLVLGYSHRTCTRVARQRVALRHFWIESGTEPTKPDLQPCHWAQTAGSTHKKEGAHQALPPGKNLLLDAQRLEVDRLLLEDPSRLLTLLLVVVEPGPGRDQLADDHVLLQAPEPVDLARDRGLGQHTGCLLEGSGREPRRRVQSRLDQAQQHGLRGGRFPALRQRPRVALLVLPLRDDLAREQAGVARGVDADLPHHLPDDDLDVLVVDVDTLAAVDLLNLVDEEGLDGFLAQDVEQLLR